MPGARGRRWLRIAAGTLVGLLALLVAARLLDLFAGTRPANLGARNGTLAPCPANPNCVSSAATYVEHAIAPFGYSGDGHAAFARLADVVAAQPRARIVNRKPDYLHAEFASAALGFVDDVEFALDAGAGTIQVRSASRLGRRDFGVNRDRIERLRAAYRDGS